MYHLREMTLQNGSKQKKILTIEFDDPKMAIISEFLMADAGLLDSDIITVFNQVLSGERVSAHISGNRCGLEINDKETVVYDLLEDMGIDSYPEVRIDTGELRKWTINWLDKLRSFQREHDS